MDAGDAGVMTEHENPPEFRELLDRAAQLPRSIEPPHDLWPAIEARIAGKRPGTGEGGSGWVPWLVIPLAAAAALAVLLLSRRGPPRPGEAWEVTRVAGVPLVGTTPLGATGALKVGDWLQTDDSSRAVTLVGDIGHVEVKPGTRIRLVRAQRTDHRLALERGEIYATVDAPPRLFFVDTPAGTVVDLGCAYTLAVDSSGDGTIRVSAGYVEFDWSGRRSIVPLGFRAETRRAFGPGRRSARHSPPCGRRTPSRCGTCWGGWIRRCGRGSTTGSPRWYPRPPASPARARCSSTGRHSRPTGTPFAGSPGVGPSSRAFAISIPAPAWPGDPRRCRARCRSLERHGVGAGSARAHRRSPRGSGGPGPGRSAVPHRSPGGRPALRRGTGGTHPDHQGRPGTRAAVPRSERLGWRGRGARAAQRRVPPPIRPQRLALRQLHRQAR